MLIDWFTVAAQVVNFLILVWLLKRFLYQPVLAAIDEREKRIATQLQDAENKKAEATKEQVDFQKKNDDFEQHRAALLIEATNAAKSERDKLLETARKDAEALQAKLQKSVEGEAEQLKRHIGTLAQREVFSIARKTLSDLADATLEARMVPVFIQRLHALTDQQKAELQAGAHESSDPAVIHSAFELTPDQKKTVQEVVKPLLHEGTEIRFETTSELVSGIELAANGRKISWSIADYLTSLSNSVNRLLEPKSGQATAPVPHEDIPRAA